MQLTCLNADHLEEICASWLTMSKKCKSAKTVERRRTACRALGRCYGETILGDYFTPTPAKAYPHPLPGGKADLGRMIGAASTSEQRALIALLGFCGLRVSEALAISYTSFDFVKRTIKVRGKGDKYRIVPLSDYAWDILFEYATKCYFQSRPTLVSLSDRTARAYVTELGVKANINRRVSSHDLRATFATAAYAVNKDIRAVQELLGHVSVVQTQLYIGMPLENMRAATDFMDTDEED